ncbi:hypothetical protein BKA81DRAFT_409750 [Phyllosticta paracitricarpa]|uniref:Uncharacterized protein n=1 Tax=Phyllosticta citricarpa TaxID=55181 RepID=A0ABR1LBR1_9PEZI
MSGNDSYIRMGEVLHMCEYGQHNLDARSHLLEHTATLLCYAGQLELKFYSNSYDLWDALNRKKANEYNNEPWDKLYFRISMLRALECNLPKMATNQYSQIDQCLEIIHHSNISAAYRRQLLTLTARALHSIDRPTPHQGTDENLWAQLAERHADPDTSEAWNDRWFFLTMMRYFIVMGWIPDSR